MAFVGFSGWSDGGRTRHAPTIFVKSSQSPPPFPLFQPLYQFPALGNNDHVSDQQEEDSMQGKVEICGVNTARLKVLSQAQMDSLLLRAKNGDEDARQELIEGNLRLVLSVIQRFSGRGENADDLFQVGCVGLIKAADGFDDSLGFAFSTYAVPSILGEIRRLFRDGGAVKISRSLKEKARELQFVKEELEKQLGVEPTISEIAEKMGISVSGVNQTLKDVGWSAIEQAIIYYRKIAKQL